jgi:hypothetical protein
VMLWTVWLSVAGAGDLSGRIVDAAGAPVPGATVVAYDQRFSYALTTTGPDGTYAIDGLPKNPYRVRVIPPSDLNLVERYLPDAFNICDGDQVSVKRNSQADFGDTVLEAGGEISGVLVDGSGAPVVDALVGSNATATADASQSRYAYSNTGGQWTLRGLALDSGSDFRVEVEVDGWPIQFLSASSSEPGVYDSEEAYSVSFVTGETDTVDLGTRTLLDGVTLSGSVTSPGAVIDGGLLHAYSPSQLIDVSIEEGRWAVTGLPPGEVLLWAEVPGMATTYYPDSDRPTQVISLTAEGAMVEEVSLNPVPESRIRGRILGEGDQSTMSLLAYNDDRTVAVAAVVEEDGHFVVEGLHGGRYTLGVFGQALGLVADELRTEAGEIRVLEVPSQGDLDLGDVEVPKGAVIEGVVTDAYAGDRIYGAFVYAESEAEGTLVLSTSDDRGRFAIEGLREGAYRIWADYQHYCDPDVDWVPRYWPDVVNPVLNGSVRVQAGETWVWNPTLPPDLDHDLMDDEWERHWGLDDGRDDANEDVDNDGFSNLEEYQLGTDPTSDGTGGCGCNNSRSSLLFLLMGPWWGATRRRDWSRSS